MNYGELENREYVVDILMSLVWLLCNLSPAVFSSFSFGIEGCFLFSFI